MSSEPIFSHYKFNTNSLVCLQPVLTVMYLVQYMPTVGYWLMDKVFLLSGVL
jgi:hypothetical protein